MLHALRLATITPILLLFRRHWGMSMKCLLVACGTGSADFNLYLGTRKAGGSVGAPLSSGGNRKRRPHAASNLAIQNYSGIVDRGFFRPFLQITSPAHSAPYGSLRTGICEM
jgi:hypothetical protein